MTTISLKVDGPVTVTEHFSENWTGTNPHVLSTLFAFLKAELDSLPNRTYEVSFTYIKGDGDMAQDLTISY